jgi:predicted hotdog family 3-hydroxylacyl-ACP dehydratase
MNPSPGRPEAGSPSLPDALPDALLDHAAIAARIPHAGPMCLLDQVVAWDDRHLECRSASHRPPAGMKHPLAHDGRLPAIAAIEYAAQAMALHGRLVLEQAAAGQAEIAAAPRRGFLAGLRSVQLHCRWIEQDCAVLAVRVERFAGDDVQVLYDFAVHGDGPIATGRAVVVLDAGARAGPTS